jgi:16S rRNA (adenine1518-N6/adenine1519-N6)-dimethyltransferase
MFLTAPHQPSALAFLVQKEVAERIARTKKESILSLSVKAYGMPKYVRTVTKGNFSPPPSVDSAILAITNISRKNFKNVSEEKFFSVVKAGFAQKRKTLAGNLKKIFGERSESALAACGIPEKARAEDVPLQKWLALTIRLSD